MISELSQVVNNPQDDDKTVVPPEAGDEVSAKENVAREGDLPQDLEATPTGEAVPKEAVPKEEAPKEEAPKQDDAPVESISADSEQVPVDESENSSDEDPNENAAPIEIAEEGDGESNLEWYILKVQSNRETSICEALRRRVAVEGLEGYFNEILVPTEDIAEFKGGKRKVTKRKLYPGYIVVHMVINDDTWFLVRETPGIGDFTGSAGRPTPMLPHEVERILKKTVGDVEGSEPVKTSIPFKPGDRVRIREGTFENFEGDVEGVDEANGRITVMINIFGRSTPVELEHWQAESL